MKRKAIFYPQRDLNGLGRVWPLTIERRNSERARNAHIVIFYLFLHCRLWELLRTLTDHLGVAGRKLGMCKTQFLGQPGQPKRMVYQCKPYLPASLHGNRGHHLSDRGTPVGLEQVSLAPLLAASRDARNSWKTHCVTLRTT